MGHLPIDAMKGLTDSDRAVLRGAGIVSPDALCASLTNDPTIMRALEAADPTAKPRVVSVAAAYAGRRAASVAVSRLRDHLPDLVVAVVMIAALVAASRKGLSPASRWISAVIVTREGGIPPFHVIRPRDVSTAFAFADPSTVLSFPEDALGRYATSRLPKDGNPIDRSRLSAGPPIKPDEWDTLEVARLNLPADPIVATMTAPFTISLAFSAGASNTIVADVYVLDLRNQGDAIEAMIAATDPKMKELAPVLNGGKFTVVWPPR